MQKTCEYCGENFSSNSKRQKYCCPSHKARAHEKRKGIESPVFVKKMDNYVRKTKDNPKISAIGNIVDSQEMELQKLKAKRNSLLNTYQRQLNSKPEFKGKLIGLGAGLYLSQNKPDFMQLFITGGLTVLGHKYDIETTKIDQFNKERYLALIQLELKDINEKITAIEIARKQNLHVLNQEPKTIPDTEIEGFNFRFDKAKELVLANGIGNNIPEKTHAAANTTIQLNELKTLKFETLSFNTLYSELIGFPEANFFAIIHGESGNGKSTWTIKFAEYLSNNFGKVLYNSSEEGISKSLQNKANSINSDYLHFGNYKDYASIQAEMDKGKYRFIVLDSINDMKLTPEDLSRLRAQFYKCGFIGILQSTKDGKFKGSNEFAHDSDIKIKLDNYIPIIEKTRFK